jgi:hypothetical protein
LFTLNLLTEILTKDEIFSKDSLIYKVSNSELLMAKYKVLNINSLTFELEFEEWRIN